MLLSLFSVYNLQLSRSINIFYIFSSIIFFTSITFRNRYFCRSVEYDEQIRRCIIFEEDSMSQKDDLRTSSSPTHDLYDLVCLDSRKFIQLFYIHTHTNKHAENRMLFMFALKFCHSKRQRIPGKFSDVAPVLRRQTPRYGVPEVQKQSFRR